MFSLIVNENKFDIHYVRFYRESFRFNDLVILYFENFNEALIFSEECVGNIISFDFRYNDKNENERVINEFIKFDCFNIETSWKSLDYINNQLKFVFFNDEYGINSILENRNYYKIILEGSLQENHDAPNFNQYIIDVMFLWFYNIYIKWEKLANYHYKYSYLMATYFVNSECDNLNVNKIVKINGNLIKDEFDLFYYLGEYMFGYKGFIGLGLDSMDDNLIDVSRICELSKVDINFSYIEKIKMSIGTEYLNSIIEILKSYKINVNTSISEM